MVDLLRPHLVPVLRVVATFVRQSQARDARLVIVDCKRLIYDDVMLSMDKPAILVQGRRIENAVWYSLLHTRLDLKSPAGFSPVGLP